ncbi:outer membrane beta-barrel protein [Sulfuricurvum sp.]|uniref:outer membrane beta-barrel protein n=1 Tax=Sulfuricurvum sp. TaxID=2025608 RepID=UPI00260E3BD3|nr:outer membrane beta-barrel protein [Sulfuricurvum sp.]MDD4950500.1 hypothetical protein [Sulfuricurvum sp.]
MKKFMIIAATAILATAANAAVKDIHLSGGTSTIDHATQPIYEIGYGVSGCFDSGLMLGIEFNVGGANTPKETTYNYSGDMRVGFSPIKNTSVYAIGSAMTQSYKNTTGYGFGYGGGMEYRFNNSFATAVEYKTFSMTTKVGDYDFDSTQLKMKYTF